MPKKYPKLDYHLICDDIRREIGNKSSLIGIHPGNVILIPIPSVIPKLCFHLVFSHLKSGDNLEIQLLGPDNKKIMSIDNIKVPEKPGLRLGVFEVGFIGINVKKEGTYRLVIVFGEEEKTEQELKIEIKKKE